MEDLTRGPMEEARRHLLRERLLDRLRTTGRLDLHVITRKVIRDKQERERTIRELVTSGEATIEVEYPKTGGRPRTMVVLRM